MKSVITGCLKLITWKNSSISLSFRNMNLRIEAAKKKSKYFIWGATLIFHFKLNGTFQFFNHLHKFFPQ